MGRYYEELQVGDRYDSPRRTVTEADIGAFAGLTGDFNPLHMDAVFAAENDFKGRITHGPMIVGMAFGLASRDLFDGAILGLLEISWTFLKAVRPGDTIAVTVGVREKSPTRKPDRGVVTFQLDVRNQHGEDTQRGVAKMLVRMKGHP
jgi:acyl dehydratase